MLNKRDVVIIVAAILLAVSFFAIRFAAKGDEGARFVKITVDGSEPEIYPLEDKTVTIERGGLINVIQITENGVKMADANCKNHDCIKQGEVTPENCGTRAMGRLIVCLPNKVTVELSGADG